MERQWRDRSKAGSSWSREAGWACDCGLDLLGVFCSACEELAVVGGLAAFCWASAGRAIRAIMTNVRKEEGTISSGKRRRRIPQSRPMDKTRFVADIAEVLATEGD